MVGTVTAGGQVMAGGSESRIVMPTQMVTLLEQRSVAVQQMLMRVGQVPAMQKLIAALHCSGLHGRGGGKSHVTFRVPVGRPGNRGQVPCHGFRHFIKMLE